MTLPTISKAVTVAEFETEIVVLVPDRRRAHLLEPLWALLFDSCRRGQMLDDVVHEVIASTGWDEDSTRQWLQDALIALRESGIVAAA